MRAISASLAWAKDGSGRSERGHGAGASPDCGGVGSVGSTSGEEGPAGPAVMPGGVAVARGVEVGPVIPVDAIRRR